MGKVASTIKGNFVAICLGLAALTALQIAIGWGQGASFAAMLLGGIIMYQVGVGQPADAPEEE